jgi:hypothetical protein
LATSDIFRIFAADLTLKTKNMTEREPFKPTIRKEDFLSEEKYLIGVEHYNQALFLPALTLNEIAHLKKAIDDFLVNKYDTKDIKNL